MCGPGLNQLPDKSKYDGLVEQFIDCYFCIGQMEALHSFL